MFQVLVIIMASILAAYFTFMHFQFYILKNDERNEKVKSCEDKTLLTYSLFVFVTNLLLWLASFVLTLKATVFFGVLTIIMGTELLPPSQWRYFEFLEKNEPNNHDEESPDYDRQL